MKATFSDNFLKNLKTFFILYKDFNKVTTYLDPVKKGFNLMVNTKERKELKSAIGNMPEFVAFNDSAVENVIKTEFLTFATTSVLSIISAIILIIQTILSSFKGHVVAGAVSIILGIPISVIILVFTVACSYVLYVLLVSAVETFKDKISKNLLNILYILTQISVCIALFLILIGLLLTISDGALVVIAHIISNFIYLLLVLCQIYCIKVISENYTISKVESTNAPKV